MVEENPASCHSRHPSRPSYPWSHFFDLLNLLTTLYPLAPILSLQFLSLDQLLLFLTSSLLLFHSLQPARPFEPLGRLFESPIELGAWLPARKPLIAKLHLMTKVARGIGDVQHWSSKSERMVSNISNGDSGGKTSKPHHNHPDAPCEILSISLFVVSTLRSASNAAFSKARSSYWRPPMVRATSLR